MVQEGAIVAARTVVTLHATDRETQAVALANIITSSSRSIVWKRHRATINGIETLSRQGDR